MSKKAEVSIAILGIAIALITLIFGDNIYLQVTGRSFGEDFRNLFAGQPVATTITPTAIHEAAEASVVSVLLSEDFEDGTADGWTVIEGKWEVIEDIPSNHVYKGVGTFWGYTIAGSDAWKNYAFEARVKGIESQNKGANFAGLDVRVDWKGSAPCERYASRLEFTNWIGWGKYGGGCSNDWMGRFYRIEMEKWYSLRFEVIGDTLKFYVDNELMLENTDSELKTGYIGLSVGENDTVYFDDVRVLAIGE